MTDCMTQDHGITQAQGTGFLKRMVSGYMARRQQRQDRAVFQHMLALDPHILKDIGVSRGDVIWANNLPLEVNAAKAL